MELFTPEFSLTIWTLYVLFHIVFGYLGAKKVLRLDIDTGLKFIWLLVIIFIPLVGVANYFGIREKTGEPK